MKIKEMFKKVDAYNELADLMMAPKAKIAFTLDKYWGDTFTDYNSFCKYIKREYHPELAKAVLAENKWEFDSELRLYWGEAIESKFSTRISIELVS